MSPFTNPYVAKFLTLRTRLSLEECCRRLQPLTLPWLSIMLVIPWAFSRLPLMGWVDPTGFAVRKRTVSRNVSLSMQPEAKTQFTVAPDGTRMIDSRHTTPNFGVARLPAPGGTKYPEQPPEA